MIAWLSGKVVSKKPSHVILDTGGVGYLVFISLPTYYSLPDTGADLSLHIHTYVKEDAIQLFGFSSLVEQEIFDLLIGVNKIGPKLAITILSGISAAELVEAVRDKDTARLSAIPGVGKKTSERLILELCDKLQEIAGEIGGYGEVESATTGVGGDAVDALVTLGYKKPEARKAVKAGMAQSPDAALEEIIRLALNMLGG